MKKTSLTTFYLLVTLTLALCLDISAQQNARAEKAKENASLERSLDQLGQELKQSVAIQSRRFNGPRKTYVRLKQRDGCNISLQVSQVPSNPYFNQRNQLPPDLSVAEWRLKLSDLDVAEVKIEAPALEGDYRVIRFATTGGKEVIKWKGFGVGDGGWRSGGWIDIGEKYAHPVAAALTQAIIACKE
jgi:hypothetical protein